MKRIRQENREHPLYFRACSGKHPHPNRKVAEFYAAKINHPRINAYKCRYCGKWHIGKSA